MELHQQACSTLVPICATSRALNVFLFSSDCLLSVKMYSAKNKHDIAIVGNVTSC